MKFDDPAIGVEWPVAQPILSNRDRQARPLAEITGLLPAFRAT